MNGYGTAGKSMVGQGPNNSPQMGSGLNYDQIIAAALGGLLLGPAGMIGGAALPRFKPPAQTVRQPSAAMPARRQTYGSPELFSNQGIEPNLGYSFASGLDPDIANALMMELEQTDAANRLRQGYFNNWRNMMQGAYQQSANHLRGARALI